MIDLIWVRSVSVMVYHVDRRRRRTRQATFEGSRVISLSLHNDCIQLILVKTL